MSVSKLQNILQDGRVATVDLDSDRNTFIYDEAEVSRAICRVSGLMGWADKNRGAFGNVVEEGSKVLVKPNFVSHVNQGAGGLLPLVTHPSLIKAVVSEVLKANPAQVLVGDAPIQGCDFDKLLTETGLARWSEELQELDRRFTGIQDFRRTISIFKNGVRLPDENRREAEDYVLFNLKEDSLLEPLTSKKNTFRVTQYDPREMAIRHSSANHQYLVARDVIEAHVVINVPKLKTHKKAGITNALKNSVGINGNKEYLPHHRYGGSDEGGDCYPGSSRLKGTLEFVLDQQNMASSYMKAKIFESLAVQLERMIRLQGDKIGFEGSWSGNETVAKMTLDLNRILLYGRADASIADSVQRRVLHLVDAVIAGQGDGPLAPMELPLKRILAGNNAAAVDWVGAHLLGFDARKIPLLRHAFSSFRWPIVDLDPQEIKILSDREFPESVCSLLESEHCQNVIYPAGWQDAKA